ncbi:hypothetical protein SHKM778_47520 [Streptomyces sp. KM77-8]|uniref:AbiJ-NTD3 domain-containing protein n=1 Tax=Streptomyces haneummycinicus TaxID=3074435 RepID=A0AAT9HLX6_9ACTN
MQGSWQARRDCIEQILGPTRNALEDLQEMEYERRFSKGPSGAFKNLIFAADGAKPQIVLRDAVDNDVEIVRHADTCLVFTDPLPPHGLTWRQMVAWWTNNHHPDADEKSAADALYRRLYRSLDSPPEQLLMITYCARYAEEGGFDLPALIPQVYLHYDPYTRRSGKQSGALYRQRMDFLLLAPDRSRIVIEVDGVQHYGRPNPPDEQGRVTHTAAPQLYADMAAEDRRLRLSGYEIYRFGGWELTSPGGEQVLTDFFIELLARHRSRPCDRRPETRKAEPAPGEFAGRGRVTRGPRPEAARTFAGVGRWPGPRAGAGGLGLSRAGRGALKRLGGSAASTNRCRQCRTRCSGQGRGRKRGCGRARARPGEWCPR